MQDVLTNNQNWTLIGIVAAVLLAVIGLLCWVVKWVCTDFGASLKQISGAVEKNTVVVGNSTQTLATVSGNSTQMLERVGDQLERLQDSHEEMRRTVESLPARWADELQRRKL